MNCQNHTSNKRHRGKNDRPHGNTAVRIKKGGKEMEIKRIKRDLKRKRRLEIAETIISALLLINAGPAIFSYAINKTYFLINVAVYTIWSIYAHIFKNSKLWNRLTRK